MAQINISDKQYVLSLDSLDLSLLSQFIDKPLGESRLLWSKQYIDGASSYYQVKIDNEDVLDECSYFEPSDTYLCHICNTEVPRICFKEHIMSKRHYNYKILTEKVLENAKKEIKVDEDPITIEASNNIFYCEACCRAVSIEHKKKHNRSKYHLKSVENQKLTENFIEMYVDNKEIETVDKKFNYNIQKNDVNESFMIDMMDSDSDQLSSVSDDDDSESPHNSYSSSSIDEIEESSNETIPANISAEIIKFEHYLKEMIAKYNIPYKIPIVENNSIVIVTPKGFKEKITMDYFHGYKKIRGLIYCQLCKMWVDKKSTHISTENHVKNILQPIDDNFIREIIDCIWSHCLICNDIVRVTGSDHAALKPNHWKYNGTTPIMVEVSKKRKQSFCFVCNKYISTRTLVHHEKSTDHMNKLQNLDSLGAPKAHAYHEDLYCKVCKIYIVNKQLIACHKKGKKHLKKCRLENRALKQLNIELKNLDLNQVPPSYNHAVSTPSTSTAVALTHAPQGEELTIEEKTFEFMKQMNDYGKTNFECVICEVKVRKCNGHIIKHVEGQDHKSAMNSLLNVHKIVQKSIKLYHCEFCEIDINDFVNHIDENIDHMVKVILHSKIDKNELRTYVYKKPLNDDPLVHAYKKVHEELLRENKIERLNGSSFYCNICHLTLYVNSEIDHMLGQRHKTNRAIMRITEHLYPDENIM